MIRTASIYNPLYTDKEKFIILVTGGRGSGKSFSVGTFIERLTFELGKDDKGDTVRHNILYTRYTMTSASISVIPEFMEKIDLDGTTKYFKTTKTDVVNRKTGGRVMFRGIKTSSGNQTAKLKSIHGITTFICDEGEEWTNEEDFERLVLSIRTKGIQNRVIIIMNPTDSNHFIYQRYIRDSHKLINIDGVDVQISTHPNVLHIHTSYFDNIKHLSPQFLKEVQDLKDKDPGKYAHVVIGSWADVAEGAVFKKWGVVKEFPEHCKKIALGMDFGYTNDFTAIVKCGIVDNDLYVEEICYKTQMLARDIIQALKPYEHLEVISESADPRLVKEIYNGGIRRIYSVRKGAGSIVAGIEKIKEYNLYVTEKSYNLQNELRNYIWAKDITGHYINEPEDHDNHLIDGLRYYVLGKILGRVQRVVKIKEEDIYIP